jgi:predicted kinase
MTSTTTSIPKSLVILIGIQGAGKTTFYNTYLSRTHEHLSLDTLKSRTKERSRFLDLIQDARNIVVDNTNATREIRSLFVSVGLTAGYRVIGYHFKIEVSIAIERNRTRTQPVPTAAIYATAKRMVEIQPDEGFHEIYTLNSRNPYSLNSFGL